MAVITISRQEGSLGDQIGRALAERLDYRFLDNSTVIAEARKYGGEIEPNAPEIEEKQPTFWERLNEERRRHTTMVRSAVYGLARDDNLVVVGLGGVSLLRGLNHVLKVLTVAPMDVRIDRVSRMGTIERPLPVEHDEAARMVRRSDRQREGYLRYMFNIEWLDAQIHDVIINTGTLSMDTVVDALAHVAHRPELRATPESSDALENMALGSRVEAALVNNAGIWIHGLRVSADRGRVTITGEVITDDDRDVAEETAMTVDGARQVVNELRIQPPPLTGM
ncbi:MAG TPA: cytidylate kinase family protein [Chloroflexota bacterium]|jgi:cytidylate kinase|nr:cytidylate kinase family protein [Chloroflexota bacterium]